MQINMQIYVTTDVSKTFFKVLSKAAERYSAKLKSGRSLLSAMEGIWLGTINAYLRKAYALFAI